MKSPIFIAAINMPGHTGGYAFVYDPTQLGGYRTVSTHFCSSTMYVWGDMKNHVEDYEKCCPDGYELHWIGEFRSNGYIRECRDEIIDALDKKMKELEEKEEKDAKL